ncbi:hypothetical protein [Fusibacter ferrireducens]|uniref:Uncharacterized protein n=1 Tax=Fusibacter ferrireducens TaxID=2785058 RepID=A0ABR9ZXS2_9FIRM|nr:hypothetical protein [Fusibacter ferrireducens]MBF4694756.1 hypothetical protein [Fusibacter ferrireducens]
MITLMDKYAIIGKNIRMKITSLQQTQMIKKSKKKLCLNPSMMLQAEKPKSTQKKSLQLWIKS